MNKKETLQSIRRAKTVFAWVNLTKDDGAYVKVTKDSIIQAVKDYAPGEDDVIFAVSVRDDGDCYIN